MAGFVEKTKQMALYSPSALNYLLRFDLSVLSSS